MRQFYPFLCDRKLIQLLSCSLVFDDSARLFADVIGPMEGNYRGKQAKILQNELGFQPSVDRITDFFY